MPSPTAPLRRRHHGSTAVITMLAALVVPATVVSSMSPAFAAAQGTTAVASVANANAKSTAAKPAATSAVKSAATTLSKNVTANLFEWNWPSIAAECTNVLGPDGYAAVQVAPPQDSLVASGYSWWQVYQPVDYNLTSMMGSPAQFQSMVSTCHAAGVKVYVDAVLNHTAAQPTSGSGTSVGGETYNPSTLSYPAYSSADFHSYPADCPESSNSIVNWLSYTEVTECQLEGLPDLATETTYVRDTEAAYLNSLIADGVDGFRLDSATEIGETDIAAIEALLNPDTTTHSPVYVTQEVYPGSSGQDSRLNPTSFEPEGSVTSFDYSYALTDDFQDGDIAALNSFSPALPSAYASSFVTNQDTERASPPTLNYTNGSQYTLADEFLLAYGYGTPQIYSSFDFSSYNQSPPVNGSGDVTNTVCGNGTWECTEQTPGIVALVGWHNLALTDNDPVENWTTDGNNMVAFSRGSDAWIAINNGSSAQTGTFPTGLANGTYCDIVNDTYSSGSCSGTPITVSGGTATVTVPAEDAVAFDINDLVTSTTPPTGTNLSPYATMTASSSASGYPPSNTNDGNTSTYWESSDGAAYPQTLTANLGQSYSLGSVTLDLPPATAWSTRTETLSVLGSTNGSSWTTLVPSANYTFNPATGNTVSFTLPSGTNDQYLQLSFTANTGWSAAQVSEFQIFEGSGGSGGTGSATLTASPSSLSFGSQTVNTTSAAQTVTVKNTGTAAASISSISAAAGFGESNTCGSSLAAGATCTVSVSFTPTAAQSYSGNLTVSSNATNPTLTVGLSGTGTATPVATLSASPSSLSFGNQATGTTSAAQTVTISNTGSAAASISSISTAAPFAETNTCGSSLAAGASCSVSATFSPSAAQGYSGNLTISSNATNGTLTVALSGTGTSSSPSSTNLALNAPVTASSSSSGYPATNAVDGNTSTYWEGSDGVWPTTLAVNLGASDPITSVVVDLPPSSAWSTRTQTLSVLGSTNDSSWTTLVSSATYTWNPSTGNTVTITLPAGTTEQYVELSLTANNVQNGAQVSEFQVWGTGSTLPDLALNASVTASSSTSGYPASNSVDGNTSTYWEGSDGVWPTTLSVNLGSSKSLGYVVLDLPPSSAWSTRTQTLSVLGSTNGSSWTTLVSSATYTWNPSTGNTVTINLPSGTSDQYVELSFTANNVQNGAQLSEFEIFG